MTPMIGTARAFLPLLLTTVACGGSAGGSADPASPAAPAPRAQPAPPMPNEVAPQDAPKAAVDPRSPWPIGPAPTEEEKIGQLERLKKDPGPLKSNWVPPGKTERYGHAEGLIAAPYDAVRAKLVDFAHYKDLAGPKFKNVRIVGKEASGTDVYFQLPIMKGLVTIWYVTRFPGPRPAAGGGEVVEGAFVKGNIKGMHIALTIRPGDEPEKTVLVCDLLLSPNVPAPQGAVDEELRDACGDAVKAVRKTTVPTS
jgi:hypothetical protein